MEISKYLEDMSLVGCMFGDVKGVFLNIWSAQVLARMGAWSPLRCWDAWLERFMSARKYKVAWHGKVRGRGVAIKGIPQGYTTRVPAHPGALLSVHSFDTRGDGTLSERGGGESKRALPVLCG